MIAMLTTAALILAAGIGPARVLSPSRRNPADRLGIAFLLGMALCGLCFFVASLAGVPFGRGGIAVPLTISAGALLVARKLRIERTADPVTYPWTATVIAVVPIVVLLVSSAIVPLSDYDGRAFWLLKARAITHEKAIDGDFFQGRSGYDPRNRYPLLVPLDVAAVYTLVGDDDDRNARWLYAFSGVALLLLLRSELGRRFGSAGGAWSAAVLAWTPQVLLAAEGSAFSAYADIPLAAFAAAAFFAMLDGEWPSFAFWLSALVITKNEGLVIAALLVCAAMLVHGRAAWTRRSAAAALAVAATVAALIMWQQRILPGDEHDLLALIFTLPSRLERLPLAALAFFTRFVDVAQWGLFWVAFAAACVVLTVRDRGREATAAILFCVALAMVYVSTYAVSPWNVEDLAATSANRLLLHMVGPAAYVILTAAGTGWRSVMRLPLYAPHGTS